MGFFSNILERVMPLFGKRPIDAETQRNSRLYKTEYEDTTKVNFTAIFATYLANRAVSDSEFTVKNAAGEDSRRAEWLQSGMEKVWEKNKTVVSQALGKGGKVLIPHVADGKAYVDAIDQSRMAITAMRGDEITGATILADIASVDGRVYYRFADYSLIEGTHTIRNRATTENGGEIRLDVVPEWAQIQPEIIVTGVEHVLFGYLKCPQDSREDKQLMGVPITYGAEEVIRDLRTCMEDMRKEYRLKKPFVGADSRLFGKDDKLPESGLFKRFQGVGLKEGQFWQVYDPAIRDSAYLARFQQLCAQLENTVGVSPGVLTEPRTANATATEIKSANAATFSMVDALRKNIEKAFEQLAYALDVLAEASGATPAGALGDWQILWDWDMSMMESSQETFGQLSELESRGLILPERLVAWATGMSFDEAKAEVDAAKALEPETVDVLLEDEQEE